MLALSAYGLALLVEDFAWIPFLFSWDFLCGDYRYDCIFVVGGLLFFVCFVLNVFTFSVMFGCIVLVATSCFELGSYVFLFIYRLIFCS